MRPLTEAAEKIGQVVDMIKQHRRPDQPARLNAPIEASAEVLKRAGYHVTVTLLPFARAMQQTTEDGHMTGVFKSAEREELFKYSDRLGDDNVVVAVAKGKEFPCAQASDLSGKRIGVQSSFCDGERLTQ
jgi:ABC-type amino acid transport substrate-binding protein